MKCTNRLFMFCAVIISVISITGCSSKSYRVPYDYNTKLSQFTFDNTNSDETADPFAKDICVASNDITISAVDINNATAAGLFDINRANTIYSKNVHKQLNPASLTKTMTALIALKYGKLDDVITASSNVNITESGAQLVGFKEGDKVTLDQALHALLMYSANDAAVIIAEYISGSQEAFAELMNREAVMIGATNTNFTNPHGLTEDNHYTTAYDLYLMFNEAVKYDKFKEIIHMNEYSSTYTDRDGNIKELSFSTTNRYLNGDFSAPSSVNVIGGKTGTTNAAGACLVLLSNDSKGSPYISIVMQANDKDVLYNEMSRLLQQVE